MGDIFQYSKVSNPYGKNERGMGGKMFKSIGGAYQTGQDEDLLKKLKREQDTEEATSDIMSVYDQKIEEERKITPTTRGGAPAVPGEPVVPDTSKSDRTAYEQRVREGLAGGGVGEDNAVNIAIEAYKKAHPDSSVSADDPSTFKKVGAFLANMVGDPRADQLKLHETITAIKTQAETEKKNRIDEMNQVIKNQQEDRKLNQEQEKIGIEETKAENTKEYLAQRNSILKAKFKREGETQDWLEQKYKDNQWSRDYDKLVYEEKMKVEKSRQDANNKMALPKTMVEGMGDVGQELYDNMMKAAEYADINGDGLSFSEIENLQDPTWVLFKEHTTKAIRRTSDRVSNIMGNDPTNESTLGWVINSIKKGGDITNVEQAADLDTLTDKQWKIYNKYKEAVKHHEVAKDVDTILETTYLHTRALVNFGKHSLTKSDQATAVSGIREWRGKTKGDTLQAIYGASTDPRYENEIRKAFEDVLGLGYRDKGFYLTYVLEKFENGEVNPDFKGVNRMDLNLIMGGELEVYKDLKGGGGPGKPNFATEKDLQEYVTRMWHIYNKGTTLEALSKSIDARMGVVKLEEERIEKLRKEGEATGKPDLVGGVMIPSEEDTAGWTTGDWGDWRNKQKVPVPSKKRHPRHRRGAHDTEADLRKAAKFIKSNVVILNMLGMLPATIFNTIYKGEEITPDTLKTMTTDEIKDLFNKHGEDLQTITDEWNRRFAPK